MFWLDQYHIDGLRVDAVASMLYLDYSRKQPASGSPTSSAAARTSSRSSSCGKLNEQRLPEYPDVRPSPRSRPRGRWCPGRPYMGGLGLRHQVGHGLDARHPATTCRQDPIHRKYHHNELTFRVLYTFTENFVLPLSHDEVVHGKGSLHRQDAGRRVAAASPTCACSSVHVVHPGKKLLFMGGEFAQTREWNHDGSFDWHLLRWAPHQGVQRWVSDLNAYYRNEPALYELDFSPDGCQWIDADDSDNSVLTYMRYGKDREHPVLVACNFTPVPRRGYRVGVPLAGTLARSAEQQRHSLRRNR